MKAKRPIGTALFFSGAWLIATVLTALGGHWIWFIALLPVFFLHAWLWWIGCFGDTESVGSEEEKVTHASRE